MITILSIAALALAIEEVLRRHANIRAVAANTLAGTYDAIAMALEAACDAITLYARRLAWLVCAFTIVFAIAIVTRYHDLAIFAAVSAAVLCIVTAYIGYLAQLPLAQAAKLLWTSGEQIRRHAIIPSAQPPDWINEVEGDGAVLANWKRLLRLVYEPMRVATEAIRQTIDLPANATTATAKSAAYVLAAIQFTLARLSQTLSRLAVFFIAMATLLLLDRSLGLGLIEPGIVGLLSLLMLLYLAGQLMHTRADWTPPALTEAATEQTAPLEPPTEEPANPFQPVVGMAAAMIILMIAAHTFPGLTRALARHARNAKTYVFASLKLQSDQFAVTGNPYYRTTEETSVFACSNCALDQNGRFVGRLGNEQSLPAGSAVVTAGDEEPINVNALLWYRVYLPYNQKSPHRGGFNTNQTYLIYKDTLEGALKLTDVRSDRPQPTVPVPSTPWHYPAITLGVVFLIGVILIGNVPWRFVQVTVTVIWLPIMGLLLAITLDAAGATQIVPPQIQQYIPPAFTSTYGSPSAAITSPVSVDALASNPDIRPSVPRADFLSNLETAVRTANQHGVSPQLVAAIIVHESDWVPTAVSKKDARGLMQLMPDTARQYGVGDRFDPAENIRGGVEFLADLSRKYGGDATKMLAAYSCGPECVDRLLAANPGRDLLAVAPEETRNAVPDILRRAGSVGTLAAVPAATPQVAAVHAPVRPNGLNQWSVIAPGNRVTTVNLPLLVGRYRVSVSGCVHWDPQIDCAGPDGGNYSAGRYRNASEFYLPNDAVGKPVLIIGGRPTGGGRQITLHITTPTTLEAIATNDRRHSLGDNRGSWEVFITKEEI